MASIGLALFNARQDLLRCHGYKVGTLSSGSLDSPSTLLKFPSTTTIPPNPPSMLTTAGPPSAMTSASSFYNIPTPTSTWVSAEDLAEISDLIVNVDNGRFAHRPTTPATPFSAGSSSLESVRSTIENIAQRTNVAETTLLAVVDAKLRQDDSSQLAALSKQMETVMKTLKNFTITFEAWKRVVASDLLETRELVTKLHGEGNKEMEMIQHAVDDLRYQTRDNEVAANKCSMEITEVRDHLRKQSTPTSPGTTLVEPNCYGLGEIELALDAALSGKSSAQVSSLFGESPKSTKASTVREQVIGLVAQSENASDLIRGAKKQAMFGDQPTIIERLRGVGDGLWRNVLRDVADIIQVSMAKDSEVARLRHELSQMKVAIRHIMEGRFLPEMWTSSGLQDANAPVDDSTMTFDEDIVALGTRLHEAVTHPSDTKPVDEIVMPEPYDGEVPRALSIKMPTPMRTHFFTTLDTLEAEQAVIRLDTPSPGAESMQLPPPTPLRSFQDPLATPHLAEDTSFVGILGGPQVATPEEMTPKPAYLSLEHEAAVEQDNLVEHDGLDVETQPLPDVAHPKRRSRGWSLLDEVGGSATHQASAMDPSPDIPPPGTDRRDTLSSTLTLIGDPPHRKSTIVYALYDYHARSTEEVSFEAGQTFEVEPSPYEGWFKGVTPRGESGLVPATYVAEYEPQVLVPLS
ncbi:hypothetical protein FRB99_008533 [Tulasnella sp. 403]|nr:hypothetical protein FRB99_008533 [Tulasnella sp. 403]